MKLYAYLGELCLIVNGISYSLFIGDNPTHDRSKTIDEKHTVRVIKLDYTTIYYIEGEEFGIDTNIRFYSRDEIDLYETFEIITAGELAEQFMVFSL